MDNFISCGGSGHLLSLLRGGAADARLGSAWTHRVGIVIRHCGCTNRNDMCRDGVLRGFMFSLL